MFFCMKSSIGPENTDYFGLPKSIVTLKYVDETINLDLSNGSASS